MSEESDDDGSGGSRRIRYADHSSGEEDEDGQSGAGWLPACCSVLPTSCL